MSTRTRASENALEPISIPVDGGLEATLIKRYKRFLADIELPSGETLTVHCPNPGSMLGTQKPGSAVRCSTHDNPKRKLAHTLEMIRVGRTWVGLHAARANALAARLLEAGGFGPFAGYAEVRSEVAVPEGSRFDFRLDQKPGESAPCWIEVKSVTLCDRRAARFPDAKTERGRRHLEHLVARKRAGERAALLFIAQRADADSVAPADDIDPAYGESIRQAANEGVEIHAIGARVSAKRIRLERVLPVLL